MFTRPPFRSTNPASSLEPLEARIAPAQVVATWTGATDGNWSDAFNWDIGVVPNNGADTYVVVIDVGVNPVITVSDPITVDSLQNAEQINVLNGTLQVLDLVSNTGLLRATGAGTLVLDGNFTTAELGSFQSSSGGIISISGTLDNTGATLLLDAMTGSLELSDGVIIGGTVSAGDGVALKLAPNSNLINGITLEGDLIVGANSSLSVINGLTLSTGRLRIEGGPGIQAALVFFNGTQTFGGSGEVLFGGVGINVIQTVGSPSTGSILTIGSGVTLHGPNGGQLNGAFALDSIINQGTILADGSGKVTQTNVATLINEGTLDATAGTLEILSNWSNPTGTLSVSGAGVLRLGGTFSTDDIGTISRDGGLIQVRGILDNTGNTLALNSTTGAFRLLANATILGGTITASAGGALQLVPGHDATLDGVTLATNLAIGNDSVLTIRNGLTLNSATISIASTSTSPSGLDFAGTQTLGGTGQVVFTGTSGTDTNVIKARGGTGGAVITIGSDITIRGTESGSLATTTAQDRFINQGIIISDVAGKEIVINTAAFQNAGLVSAADGRVELRGDWSNAAGTLSVSGSGTLNLGGTFSTADFGTISRSEGTIHLMGILDNTGATLTLTTATGPFLLTGGATIIGGTVTSPDGTRLDLVPLQSAVLNGVTLGTGMTIPGQSTLTILNGLTLNGGTIAMTGGSGPSTLFFSGTQSLSGSGAITFSSGVNNSAIQVSGTGDSAAQSATLTIGEDIQIFAPERLEGVRASDRIINQGTIVTFEADQVVTVAASSFVNEGTVNIQLGTLVLQGAFTQTAGGLIIDQGLVSSSGTALQFEGGLLAGDGTIMGSVTNNGAVLQPGVSGPGILTISGNYTHGANATLNIEINSAGAGTGHDQLVVTGSATLGGHLAADVSSGYTYGEGATLEVIQASSVSGFIASVSGLDLFTLSISSTTVQLTDDTVIYTWDGSESDDWFVAANWTPEGVPGPQDIVNFNLASMIRLSMDATVGRYTQSAGTLTGSGNLTVLDRASWSGGMMSGTGFTQFAGELFIDGGTVDLSGRTLIIPVGGQTLIGGNGGQLRLSGSAFVINAGVFTTTFNSGGITAASGTPPSVFVNQGNFENYGTVMIDVPFINFGAVSLNENSLTFTGGFTQLAEGVTLGGGTIIFDGGIASVQGLIGADVVNFGSVFAPGGIHQAGSLIIEGSYQQSGGTLSIDIGGKTAGLNYDQLTILGNVNLEGGQLAVRTLGSYVLKSDSTFQVLNYTSAFGSFTSLDAPAGVEMIPNSNGLALTAQKPTATSRTLTAIDSDGDIVTIKVDKGAIPDGAVTYGPNNEIQSIDLRAVDSKLLGGKVTISVVQNPDGGDGAVTIGQIRADGLNLKKLDVRADVGEIDAGTGKKEAIKVLSVNSLGLGDPGSNPGGVSDINGSIGKLNIRGDVLNAVLYVSGKLGKVTIGGDFNGETSGFENFRSLQDVLRGKPRASGGIPVGSFNADSIGSFKVEGSMKSGGVSAEKDINSVSVAGDVNGGGVAAGGRIKVVKVFGSMMSDDPENPFVLAALGQKKGKAIGKPIIDQLMVKNDVENARILLGYNKDEQPMNPDATVKKVIVKGDWVASSIVAGVVDATGDGFGINDTVFPNDTTKKAIGTIASIVIKGTATGSAVEGEHYAITAQKVGKLSINGEKISLDKKAKDNILLDEENGNFRLVEL